MFVEVGVTEYEKLDGNNESPESSKFIRERVERARAKQLKRFGGLNIITNSEMGVLEIRQFCVLGEQERAFMKKAALKMALSGRAYHRVLKLARTIADLMDSANIQNNHLAEALQHRNCSNA